MKKLSLYIITIAVFGGFVVSCKNGSRGDIPPLPQHRTVKIEVALNKNVLSTNPSDVQTSPGDTVVVTSSIPQVNKLTLTFPESTCDDRHSKLNVIPATCVIRNDATPGSHAIEASVVVSSCGECAIPPQFKITSQGQLTVVNASGNSGKVAAVPHALPAAPKASSAQKMN